MSFLRNLFRGVQHSPTPVFPSASYVSLVWKANEEWLAHCIKHPLLDGLTNTRVHILGTSLLNLPSRDVQRAISNLKGNLGWICVDEAEESAMWLNRYAAILKQGHFQDLEERDGNVETSLQEVRTWVERKRGEFMDAGVPDEWIDALESTGLRPGWDTIEAVERGQQERLPVEFIGIGHAEETSRYFSSSAKMASMDPNITEEAPTVDLQSELRQLFHKVGVSLGDMKNINTGSPLADSRLQSLVLDPKGLAAYHKIISKHLMGMHGEAGRRRQEGEARKAIKCERIIERLKDVCEEVGAQREGVNVLAVIDRNHVEGVRRLWEEGDDNDDVE
ncbi:uncharacterized protein SPPG_05940 [Spizellomyces punctatus DAOM BR117]|uniref:Uncharacterized protein n=1 Tax=Spizellomyces punctatus (strain DAOM BR117) TaxID=645134 RepID=A0A0L0HCV2_SPIPD|nr:uncharacterized protein SPPG_05940 [Spizellomyces punctatus DAOM BR117]KNC98987.1 hypothetical protein SPPG_05940 [Spizellomyces punctatus DAOM BR117]|eukprot:XP_016607027.1 hypothetical protein SPPG_05940 [Spizellomyces punctatus DAOM BR117]